MDLEEAARIDGASRLQTMRQIFLPLCTPGFISAGIFAFTLSQNEFLYALIFLTQSSVRTVPVGVIAELTRGDVFYWGQLMAGALLGSIPVALIYSFFRRALRRRADLRLGERLEGRGAQCVARIGPVTSRWSSLHHRATAIGGGQPLGGSTRAAPAEPPSPSDGARQATSPAEEAIAMPRLRQR
jgi:binding-protein-dependent transport system inner membrane component